GLDQHPQRLARTHELVLAHDVVEPQGPQPGGERCLLRQVLLGRRREQVATTGAASCHRRPRLPTPAPPLAPHPSPGSRPTEAVHATTPRRPGPHPPGPARPRPAPSHPTQGRASPRATPHPEPISAPATPHPEPHLSPS